MKSISAVALSFILGILFSPGTHAELTLAIYPWKDAKATYAQFKSFTEQLSNRLGERIRLVVSNDQDAFWRELLTGRFDIILLEQHQFLQVSKTLPYELLGAAEKADTKEDRSVLVVANESKLKTIRDLKGRQLVLAKNPRDLAAHLLPLQLVKTSGLREKRDFAILYSPDSYLSLEMTQRSDQLVVGLSEARLNQLMQANSAFASKIRLLATSPSYPTFHCWSMKSTLPDELRQRIRSYFVELASNTTPIDANNKAGYARIYPIIPQDLDQIARLMSRN